MTGRSTQRSPRRWGTPSASSRVSASSAARSISRSLSGVGGPARHGSAGLEEHGYEPLRAEHARGMTRVDRVDGGAGDRLGQLDLTGGRHPAVTHHHDDGSRDVDLTDPVARAEAADGRERLEEGRRWRAPELLPRPTGETANRRPGLGLEGVGLLPYRGGWRREHELHRTHDRG